MINYIVEDLEEFIAQLNENRINIIGEIEGHKQGRFAWILDQRTIKLNCNNRGRKNHISWIVKIGEVEGKSRQNISRGYDILSDC